MVNRRHGGRAATLAVASLLAVALAWSSGAPAVRADPAPVDLAEGRPATATSAWSQGQPGQAVDADETTFWQPLSGDRVDDGRVALTVDLGPDAELDTAVLAFPFPQTVGSYVLEVSGDERTWTPVHESADPVQAEERPAFAPASGRWLRLTVTLSDPSADPATAEPFRLSRLSVYRAEGATVLPNLVRDAPVEASSSYSQAREEGAVDGDPATFWRPLSGDYADGEVWITADLGDRSIFDSAQLDFAVAPTTVEKYQLLYSDDNENWSLAFESSGELGLTETADFDLVSGRYLRVSLLLSDTSTFPQVAEVGLYNGSGQPQPETLREVVFTDPEGQPYDPRFGTIDLNVGDSVPLSFAGTMSDDQPADLSEAEIVVTSEEPEIARVEDGRLMAVAGGVTTLDAKVTLDGSLRSVEVFVDARDPEVVVADLGLAHPTMAIDLGTPAWLEPGEALPTLTAEALVDLSLTADLVNTDTGETVGGLAEQTLTAGSAGEFTLDASIPDPGIHELRVAVTAAGRTMQDVFAFTVRDPQLDLTGQSRAAFVGADGTMHEVPDYHGNRILDFSDVGYEGGGVTLPEAQVRVRVEPGAGDDSARVQAAIDEVSAMPQDTDGLRGAVLLAAGTYQLGETLVVDTSGVVLRGEGQSTDGTVLLATGTEKRNVVELEGTGGVQLQPETTEVTDLYVPVGSRSFHVTDPSQFEVGDTVVVARHGNDRWIHAIDMDSIVPRPTNPDATRQFEPFDLDFDRVITGIDGDRVTVDAPLANSIERRWGGATMTRYDDTGRIEQVGIENLRIDIEIDESQTETVDVEGEQVTFYTDPDHAQNAVWIDNAKNVWMRDVTGLRSSNAIVWVNTGAKWVTIQDTTSIEQAGGVSSARAPYNLSGQLTLVQRSAADGSRHSFGFQAQVPGPNVFLDTVATRELNTSEPHQRWSVGGLYDNVTTDLAIQDRAWLGSGHGWSGANYVAWNTEGSLVVQRPPTATNYAIGHVGSVREPFAPNQFDPRPREEGYWESLGSHVEPDSLYRHQLTDRLGADAVTAIEKVPYGSGALDQPRQIFRPALQKEIRLDGGTFTAFEPEVFDYVVEIPADASAAPVVSVRGRQYRVTIDQADSTFGEAVVTSINRQDPERSIRYTFRFVPAA